MRYDAVLQFTYLRVDELLRVLVLVLVLRVLVPVLRVLVLVLRVLVPVLVLRVLAGA